jgi:hypothetical protein
MKEKTLNKRNSKEGEILKTINSSRKRNISRKRNSERKRNS